MGRPYATVVKLAATVAVLLFLRAEVAEPVRVSSDSMSPTLQPGEHVLLEKVTPLLGGVHRGELVAFRSPTDGALVVKRVVGVAGDTVAIRDALLYVNDELVREPQLDASRIDATYFGPVTVEPDRIFVLGDNRDGSVDSRAYGLVPLALVDGRVLRSLEPQWRDR